VDVQPAMDLIERNFGKGAVRAFNLTIGEDACDSAEGKMVLPFSSTMRFSVVGCALTLGVDASPCRRRASSAWLLQLG
jgi:hypothetical protein